MYNKPKMSISNVPKRFSKWRTPFYFLKPLFTSPGKQFSKALVRLSGNEQAQSLAEFVIALPLLVVFLTLTHQVWSTIDVNKALDDTAREAARFASLQVPPMTNIQSTVNTYVAASLVPYSRLKIYDPTKISVNVERLTANMEDTPVIGAVNAGDILRVSVSLAANTPGGFYSYLVSSPTIVRTAAYTQASPLDGPLEPTPTPTEPPGCLCKETCPDGITCCSGFVCVM